MNTYPQDKDVCYLDFFQVDPMNAYGVNPFNVFSNAQDNDDGFSFFAEENSPANFSNAARSAEKKISENIFKFPSKIQNSMIGEPLELTGVTQQDKELSKLSEGNHFDTARAECKFDNSESFSVFADKPLSNKVSCKIDPNPKK